MCLGYRLSKHKMTWYSKKSVAGWGRHDPCLHPATPMWCRRVLKMNWFLRNSRISLRVLGLRKVQKSRNQSLCFSIFFSTLSSLLYARKRFLQYAHRDASVGSRDSSPFQANAKLNTTPLIDDAEEENRFQVLHRANKASKTKPHLFRNTTRITTQVQKTVKQETKVSAYFHKCF